ncbi:FHA domain-containing protein [Streptomyces sp. NPDC051452]|uniref:FHA domain-containing protein n=1 Tax=Streptomyces sp. NPDC051452 TaxID=3365654 RepID=UPI00378ED3C6
MTSSFEFSTYPARLSDVERDKALQVLRDGVAMGRLSHDTFVRRMELALAARRSDELAALVADLPRENRLSRAVLGSVEAVSGFTVRLRRAWQAERLPKLLLPHPAHGGPLRIGRDPSSGLRLNHETVSRAHAELSRQGGLWVLKDLGSTNGTTVNGRRVTGSVVVREGDQVAFGRMAFRLSATRVHGGA